MQETSPSERQISPETFQLAYERLLSKLSALAQDGTHQADTQQKAQSVREALIKAVESKQPTLRVKCYRRESRQQADALASTVSSAFTASADIF